MNDHEPQQQTEQRSSFKINLNAKREAQVEVKIYTGDDEAELDRTREIAVRQFKETLQAVGG